MSVGSISATSNASLPQINLQLAADQRAIVDRQTIDRTTAHHADAERGRVNAVSPERAVVSVSAAQTAEPVGGTVDVSL
jgi:hypothetical protein